MGDAMIRSAQVKTCLVVAAEVKSRSVDPADGDTGLLFGDGAGAVVLRGEPEAGQLSRGILGLRLHADGAQHDLIRIPAGGSRRPTTSGTVEAKSHTLRMQGAPLFRLAVKRLDQTIREILKEFGIDVHDIAQLVLHQANGREFRPAHEATWGLAGTGLFRDRTLRQYVVGVIADRARPRSPFGKEFCPTTSSCWEVLAVA